MGGVTAKIVSTLRAYVDGVVAPLKFHGLIRYRVIKTVSNRVELQIFKKTRGFPDILPISLACGVPGAKGEPAEGSVVLVHFIEGDPSLPVVTHFERPGQPGFVPVSVSIDASDLVRIGASADLVELGSGSEFLALGLETGRSLRYGDSVQISGVVVSGGSGSVTGVVTLIPAGGNVSKVKA